MGGFEEDFSIEGLSYVTLINNIEILCELNLENLHMMSYIIVCSGLREFDKIRRISIYDQLFMHTQ